MNRQDKYRIAVRGMLEFSGKYLLLHRAKPARNQHGFWELPGGGLDFGESPQGALIREISEETDLEAEVYEPLSVWHYMRGEHVEIIGMTFRCRALSDKVILSDEHLDYAWLTIDQIKTKKIFPELLFELEDMKL